VETTLLLLVLRADCMIEKAKGERGRELSYGFAFFVFMRYVDSGLAFVSLSRQ
jgi:hypothetical protein